MVSLAENDQEKTKTFTIGILGQKGSKIKNFHCCYPWPKMTMTNWYLWPKRLKNQKLSPLETLAKNSQGYFLENG